MTKIAVITDVHANLPALEAALDAIEVEAPDAIYHLGDAIGIGPYPAETLDRLLHVPTMHFLMGNHDAWFAFGLPDTRPNAMSEGEFAHRQWAHAQLDPSLRAVVADWPYVLEHAVHGLPVAFTHYARTASRSNFAPIVAHPTGEDLDQLFASYKAPLVFYGHHHPASDLTSRARYVNPGALGCFTKPLARFVILEVGDNGTYQLQHRAVPYDHAELEREFYTRAVPERDFILRAFFGRETG